jgi:serine phosphatase RsbU (regulator of sigma subunit)
MFRIPHRPKYMKIPFKRSASARQLRQPVPTKVPLLETTSIAAVYRAARVGGDFFDFVTTESDKLVFLLVDVAGKRTEAMNIAAAVQDHFRADAAKAMGPAEINHADAIAELLLDLNRTIIDASGGVRCAPAFLGCYEQDMGMLWYVNAGHPAALVRDEHGVTPLESNGIPLGLFSHATHDAQICVVAPGAAVVLASKGLVEAKRKHEEFGLKRLKEVVQSAPMDDARSLCQVVIDAVNHYTKNASGQNDATALAMVRMANVSRATSD